MGGEKEQDQLQLENEEGEEEHKQEQEQELHQQPHQLTELAQRVEIIEKYIRRWTGEHLQKDPQKILQEIHSLADYLPRGGRGGRGENRGVPGDMVVILVSGIPEKYRFVELISFLFHFSLILIKSFLSNQQRMVH